jgi:hypothetical protein
VDLLDRLADLPGALEAGEVPAAPEFRTEHRLGAVAATDEAAVRARVTSAVRERPDAQRVLDVGGAPGPYAREFVRRGFAVALVDDPAAAAIARPFLAREAVEVVERDLTGSTGTDVRTMAGIRTARATDPATSRSRTRTWRSSPG